LFYSSKKGSEKNKIGELLAYEEKKIHLKDFFNKFRAKI
jgi:hypothetical protein